mmetsp:Transcript_24520/g.68181  ORF Transcript_24520/g.68181 Transcript_24520/m.68181 type:complete len:202 (-) Transcript_24520:304-909(-)
MLRGSMVYHLLNKKRPTYRAAQIHYLVEELCDERRCHGARQMLQNVANDLAAIRMVCQHWRDRGEFRRDEGSCARTQRLETNQKRLCAVSRVSKPGHVAMKLFDKRVAFLFGARRCQCLLHDLGATAGAHRYVEDSTAHPSDGTVDIRRGELSEQTGAPLEIGAKAVIPRDGSEVLQTIHLHDVFEDPARDLVREHYQAWR